MILILASITALLVFTGCNKNDPAMDIREGISIWVEDNEGNDLLDPDFNGGIETSKIRIKVLDDDGTVKELSPTYWGNHVMLDYPFGYGIFSGANGSYYIGAATHKSINYIDWGNGNVDKYECTFRRGHNYIILSEVTFNDQVVWKENQSTNEYLQKIPCFKIVIDGNQRTILLITPEDLEN